MMKKLATLALLFSIYSLHSQGLQIGEGQVKHEKQMRPCIEVSLEPAADEVKDAWEDFLKDEYDVKLKGNGLFTNKDVLCAEKVDFKAISGKSMDFYTRIVEENNRTNMCVFGSFGYDIYINPSGYPLEYKRMEDITKRFLSSYLPDFYEEQVKNAKETLADLRNEQSDMDKELEENRKQMEKLRERNEELENKLPQKRQEVQNAAQSLNSWENNWSDVKSKINAFGFKKD
jgi:hypothetical protein